MRGVADVVFGSRLSGGRPQRAYLFWHLVGNRFLTLLTNVLYNTTLSDMETGYKAFRAEVLRSLDLRENGFGDRAGDHGEGLQAQAPHLRAADLLLRAHATRRARRSPGATASGRSGCCSRPRSWAERGRVEGYDRTIDETIRYSFVIPAYNEQETLPEPGLG